MKRNAIALRRTGLSLRLSRNFFLFVSISLALCLSSCLARRFDSRAATTSAGDTGNSRSGAVRFPPVASVRAAGVLLHPTSLPGPYGIGELGPQARQAIDFMAEAGFTLWQLMPMGPTGYGDSPYSAYSAFALNPLLISIDELVRLKLISQTDAEAMAKYFAKNATQVNFGEVYRTKLPLLKKAFQESKKQQSIWSKVTEFSVQQKDWLDDFATFAALKEEFNGAPWVQWPEFAAKDNRFKDVLDLVEGVKNHNAQRIAALAENLIGNKIAENKEFHIFLQYIVDSQWQETRRYANEKGIAIISDVPYYVGHDSVDVWADRALFRLKENGEELFVSGVPGQRWGHPVFNWEQIRKQNYDWWIRRFRTLMRQSDYIRVDHFLAFAKFYQFEKSNPSDGGKWEEAVNGRPMKDYGYELFTKLTQEPEFKKLQDGQPNALPFVVEDLGEHYQEMFYMRDYFGMAGVNIYLYTLEKAQDSREEIKYFPRRSIVYTGTHDNETAIGFALSHDVTRFGWEPLNAHRSMREGLFYQASSNWVILPMQDVFGKDNNSRMNVPGRADGNWHWRFEAAEMYPELAKELLTHICRSGRRNAKDAGCEKLN